MENWADFEDIIGNDRDPERALLRYVYNADERTVLLTFASNQTWKSDRRHRITLRFREVENYFIHFPRPRIEEWAKVDGNDFNGMEFHKWVYLDVITLKGNTCRLTFHDGFGERKFTFSAWELEETEKPAQ